ncbi:Ig-like domain-containing protein [Brucepastera parasyntrophica]|uniref:Ig-like domain-containing protein n=1 Tax=Brucepastera parasyntrophica TaxID=2880008 RepID=UPI00210CA04D|nr:Ig-like domain-containing protein [Brucepastera parasyntrophica]ULQ59737.1 Ig-like domain-containing protein [Brucepastera parasyntrophica]
MELWHTGEENGYILGWLGNPGTQVKINGLHPSQDGRVFWLPVNRLSGTNNEGLFILEGRYGQLRVQETYRMPSLGINAGTFDQGTELTATLNNSIIISGSLASRAWSCYINGEEHQINYQGRYFADIPLRKGYQTITVEIRDGEETLAFWTKEVYRVTAFPDMRFEKPAGNTKSRQVLYTLTGCIANGFNLEVSMNGEQLADTNGFFRADVSLSEGINDFIFEATDSCGQVIHETIRIECDTTAPEILSVVYPQEEFITVSEITVLLESDESGPVWWQMPDGTWDFAETNPYEKKLKLADGDYEWPLKAADPAGNISDARIITLTVDTTLLNLF